MSDLGNKKVFAQNLNYYMNLNHKDRNDIARDLNLPYTTITSWCKAEFYPRIDKIQLLANYFGIKKSDLVEHKEKNNSIKLEDEYNKKLFISADAMQLLENYNKLNDFGKETANQRLEELTKIDEYTKKNQNNTANR